MSTTKEVQYGWFSQKQKNINKFGRIADEVASYIYLDADNKEVEVTEVSPKLKNEEHKKAFPDSKYIGIVVKFIRQVINE